MPIFSPSPFYSGMLSVVNNKKENRPISLRHLKYIYSQGLQYSK